MLIHGIIDGYYIKDDEVTLFDYKTDYIDPAHQDEGLQKLVERYRGQLNLYAAALTNMTRLPVTHKILYALDASRPIEI